MNGSSNSDLPMGSNSHAEFLMSSSQGLFLSSQFSDSSRAGMPRHPRGDIGSTEHGSLLTTDPNSPIKLIYGTAINVQESTGLFKDFLLNFTLAQRRIANGVPESEVGEHEREPFYPKLLRQMKEADLRNLNLDGLNLRTFSKKLYKQLLNYPQEIIPLMDFCLTEIYMDTFEDIEDNFDGLRVRPFNLENGVNMRSLDPRDIDRLVTVKGLLIRTSGVIPDLKEAFFRCQVCEGTVTVKIDRGRINEPTRCMNELCGAKNTLKLIHNRCLFSDRQVCRLQETPDEVPAGQTPYTATLLMYDDLVDSVKPGDRVEVTGVYRGIPVRVQTRQQAVRSLFKTYIDVVQVRKTSNKRLDADPTIVSPNEYLIDCQDDAKLSSQSAEDEAKVLELSKTPGLYELLAQSVAPSIFGMEDVKKGVLLQLFGGASHLSGAGRIGQPRVRGDINVLLVGDPGVSKSQLLSYVHKIAPRGIYTSGKGSSAVGLTAYVTKDPESKQLVLESGALVLSDGGVCCIDEFDKMTDQTRSVLHEVMEQQTVSIAKAGIITTLNARTSILACANPINSKFDTKLSILQNINLPPTLLSRFDLVYLLLDKPDEDDDRRLASHIVNLYVSGEKRQVKQDFVPIDDFTLYINYAKQQINPVISEEAGELLVECYVRLRHTNNRAGGKTFTATTRQLESLIRLSEAHARARLSSTVDVSDVEEANRLLLTAMQSSAINPATGIIDIDLINTGISALSRQLHSDKVREIKKMLMNTKGVTFTFRQLYDQFNKQTSKPVTEGEFLSSLEDVAAEQGNIFIRGLPSLTSGASSSSLKNFDSIKVIKMQDTL